MRQIKKHQIEMIDAVIAEGAGAGLNEAILEKDIHVTEALHALFAMQFAHIELAFCGGTSLSKAHGIIERMSEDVDVKIVLSDTHGMSRSALKNHLSQFKQAVEQQMLALGFVPDPAGQLARNENRYVATRWLYDSRYGVDSSLRPYLSLEYTVRTPQFATEPVAISYLVDKLAGQAGAGQSIRCVAVAETLAEKVLSFLRRHAQHRAGQMRANWDTALVRHIYDVYCIALHQPAALLQALSGFPDLVAFDVQEFHHHAEFVANPKATLLQALALAEAEPQTRSEYQNVLLPLVYGAIKPSFAVAFAEFKRSSAALLATLP